MKTTIIVMLACLTALITNVSRALGDEFTDNAQVLSFSDGRIFSSITASNNLLIVGLPLMQARYIVFINNTNAGFGEAFKTVSMNSGDTIDLVERHTNIRAKAEITPEAATLRVTRTFDARSFGDTIRTNYFIFQESREQHVEQGGPGYPPQSVGSPDP